MRRTVPLLLAATLVLGACTSGDVADFGAGAPGADAPDLPSDHGLDVTALPAAEDVPPRDAGFEPAGWPQVASWIAREAADDRPVVLNFFASFCEPCKRELPLLLDTADAEEEITFVGIHTNEQQALGARMVDEYDITFPTFHDPAGDVVFELGGRGLPHTVAFDADGRLVSRVFGELTPTNLDRLLAEVR